MLQINVPLAQDLAATTTVNSNLLPAADVRMELNEGERRVHITLKGVICGASVDSMLEFLHSVSNFVGHKWSLQMNDLLVLSSRGMKALVRFVKRLRRRGYVVEVAGINRNIYAVMQELKLAHAFAGVE